MDLPELVRSRRTHKAYAPAPVDRATLDELFELARWAPNHNLTNPWRFRVLGPGRARAAQGGRRARGRRQARPRADARRRLGRRRRRPGRRPRRTATPPRAPATSCCSRRTTAGSAATGARPASCARRRAAPRAGSRTARRCSACCTSARRAATSRRPSARRSTRRHPPGLMLARADALAALADEPFDVLVIGGGITGAGVALDAASRGYSRRAGREGRLRARDLVALEQARPRRAALPAEVRPRAGPRGAARAPAAGRAGAAPRPAAAARRARVRRRAAGPARRDRAEHVRRDGASTGARRRRGREDDWSPERHRDRSTAPRCSSCCPRSPRASRPGGYLFYDCQTDDVRLVLTVLARGRALRRGRGQPGRGGRARPTAGARGARRRRRRRARRSARRTSSTRPACGPTGCGRRSCTTRPRCR